MTNKQKMYPYTDDKQEVASVYASRTQKFLYESFSKILLSKAGIISVLTIWTIFTGLSIAGLSQLEVDFKITYLISEERPVRKYIDKTQ